MEVSNKPPVPTEWEAVWAPEPVCFRSLFCSQEYNHIAMVIQPVA